MNDIPEKDWKNARTIIDKILNKACKRSLEKFSKIIENDNSSHHTRYLELRKLIKYENENITKMFDDFKRSTSVFQIALWKFNNLITDDDMKLFSQNTKERVDRLIEMWR